MELFFKQRFLHFLVISLGGFPYLLESSSLEKYIKLDMGIGFGCGPRV